MISELLDIGAEYIVPPLPEKSQPATSGWDFYFVYCAGSIYEHSLKFPYT